MGAFPVMGAGRNGAGPATKAPLSWWTTSSAERETNNTEPTWKQYHRPGKAVPFAGSEYRVR